MITLKNDKPYADHTVPLFMSLESVAQLHSAGPAWFSRSIISKAPAASVVWSGYMDLLAPHHSCMVCRRAQNLKIADLLSLIVWLSSQQRQHKKSFSWHTLIRRLFCLRNRQQRTGWRRLRTCCSHSRQWSGGPTPGVGSRQTHWFHPWISPEAEVILVNPTPYLHAISSQSTFPPDQFTFIWCLKWLFWARWWGWWDQCLWWSMQQSNHMSHNNNHILDWRSVQGFVYTRRAEGWKWWASI